MRGWLALAAAFLLIIVISCAVKHLPEPQSKISEGERLYRANCRSCHTLRDPASHTDEQWPGLVHRYGDRIHLSPESQQKILDYLLRAN